MSKRSTLGLAAYFAAMAAPLLVAGYVLTQGAETSSDFAFDPTDIQYTIDPDTGHCFALTAIQSSRDIFGTESGIGMSRLPCDAQVTTQINPALLQKAEANGIALKM